MVRNTRSFSISLNGNNESPRSRFTNCNYVLKKVTYQQKFFSHLPQIVG